MGKNVLLIAIGLLIGIALSIAIIFYSPFSLSSSQAHVQMNQQVAPTGHNQVIGFIPYWLLSKANTDYSQYITTLTYFALRIDHDGSIVEKTRPTEYEPGWYALMSGKVDPLLQQAKAKHTTLSLALDTGDISAIDALIASPSASAQTLVSQAEPILTQYGFADLNLDIEYAKNASNGARKNFVEFIKQVRNDLPSSISLTLEISPFDTIQTQLIDIKQVGQYANSIILMAYDYHAPDSMVTGPVAPLLGAGVESEFDVATAVNRTLQLIPSQKLVLGVPLYGYEWETLGTVPRSAIIPGSGVLASNDRVEKFLSSCASCSVQQDADAAESYISFFSHDTHTNHIIFFPDEKSTSAKIGFAKNHGLGGLALWALGYEGKTILTPLNGYKNGN